MEEPNSPILFIFSGLPASGKSTLAKFVATKYNAVYLRVDTIEQGLRDLCHFDVQGEGYRLSYKIAVDNLQLGMNIVADSCNPILLTRKEWEEVAKSNNNIFINIEVICSDESEHKRRVLSRKAEIENLALPDWTDIKNREYHCWKTERITIDTAYKSIAECEQELIDKIQEYLRKEKSGR